MTAMDPNARIYVAGHRGLVGSAIVRRLQADGFTNVVTADHNDLDLTDAAATEAFFAAQKPELVFLAAAKVGGIKANATFPADFIRVNLKIETNVIEAAHRHGTHKLLFLGSSCIYPKHAPQPMQEQHLLTGPLETTNQAYAVAKIAGLVACHSYDQQYSSNFIGAQPTNLYGPGDNFDLQSSHVLPAILRKLHEAKQRGDETVTLWGTGTPRRELLYVDDLADACVFLMQHFDAPPDAALHDIFVNVGVGEDLSIAELAAVVQDIVGYDGEIVWDRSMPDGTPRKLLDVSRLAKLGWRATTSLADGIRATYAWFLAHPPTN